MQSWSPSFGSAVAADADTGPSPQGHRRVTGPSQRNGGAVGAPVLAASREKALAGDRQVVAGAGAVPCATSRLVAPQALHGVLLAVVASDVVEPAGDGGGRSDSLRVTDPGALVTVLVGRVVVPAAEIDTVDHVLGAGVRDRLFDLVPHDDR